MTDTQQFKEKLEKEAATIEEQLSSIGRKNVTNNSDWEAVEPEMDTDRADETEVADSIEQYQANSAVLNNLEIQLNEVKNALQKIENGTYGTCEVSGEPIEEDRLLANPAARTCKKHMNE